MPLPEFSFEPLCRLEIAQLEQERLCALEDRIEAELALGRHAELLGELRHLCARDPLNERIRASLMLALFRSGHAADAAKEYESLVETLGALGLRPGVELGPLTPVHAPKRSRTELSEHTRGPPFN